jgi:hypothetical protein
MTSQIHNTKSDISPVENMISEINKKGGEFHFDVAFSEVGWMAECREFPQITTWGEGHPTDEIITAQTRDAVRAAFGIPEELNSSLKLDKRTDYENSYASVRLNLQKTEIFSRAFL